MARSATLRVTGRLAAAVLCACLLARPSAGQQRITRWGSPAPTPLVVTVLQYPDVGPVETPTEQQALANDISAFWTRQTYGYMTFAPSLKVTTLAATSASCTSTAPVAVLGPWSQVDQAFFKSPAGTYWATVAQCHVVQGVTAIGYNLRLFWEHVSQLSEVDKHEMGHNWGLAHDHRLTCGPSGCAPSEYGGFSIMGGQQGAVPGGDTITGFEKWRLGAVAPGRGAVDLPPTGGTVALERLDTPPSANTAVKVFRVPVSGTDARFGAFAMPAFLVGDYEPDWGGVLLRGEAIADATEAYVLDTDFSASERFVLKPGEKAQVGTTQIAVAASASGPTWTVTVQTVGAPPPPPPPPPAEPPAALTTSVSTLEVGQSYRLAMWVDTSRAHNVYVDGAYWGTFLQPGDCVGTPLICTHTWTRTPVAAGQLTHTLVTTEGTVTASVLVTPPPPPADPCVAQPLVPTVLVTALDQVVTWTGAVTVTDTRGCRVVVTK